MLHPSAHCAQSDHCLVSPLPQTYAELLLGRSLQGVVEGPLIETKLGLVKLHDSRGEGDDGLAGNASGWRGGEGQGAEGEGGVGGRG